MNLLSSEVFHNVMQNVTLLFGLCLYTVVIYRATVHGRDAIHSVLFDCVFSLPQCMYLIFNFIII